MRAVTISSQRLEAIVDHLRTRPGHEHVRSTVKELFAVALDIPDQNLRFEVPVPEVNGRIDAIFGSTVFEFKRDLRRERREAELGLTRYLADREKVTGRRFLGIATDGAEFIAYQLSNGRLKKFDEFVPAADDPRGLLRWLDTATTARDDLYPDAISIRSEFGRDSLVFRRAMEELRELWNEAQSIPEAELKKQLWSRHLEFVYGTLIEPDELFLQHTYLTIIAKMMAIRVLQSQPVTPIELLEGVPFSQVGLHGAVEIDFFDWVRLIPDGPELVGRIMAQVQRFRLSEIEVDILKAIYESLIDPRQRHYLGEYYTPDWLASWICDKVFTDPLRTRALDPACGSGTFLFHAVRKFLATAETSGIDEQESLDKCTDHVIGLDVHPVAVLFSRVTYLLAIGSERLQKRTGPVFVPVYLGDSLQWNVRPFLTEEEVEIAVPEEPPLRFPGSVAGNPHLLELVLGRMRELADQNAGIRAFQGWLNSAATLPEADRRILSESYDRMRVLHETGRNHIWTYIVRNLTRPLWLTLREGKPDLLIGNPPWLRYNAMSKDLQQQFRRESLLKGLWVGGKLATHQDLSSYFFARCAERYLRRGGTVAFIMPMATLSRGQYKGFRSGRFADRKGNVAAIVRFDEVWTFDSDVKHLFEVPSCVIFGERVVTAARLPDRVTAYEGELPRRDATAKEARDSLSKHQVPWPKIAEGNGISVYGDIFKQGATIVPRRFAVVSPVEHGRFGSDPNAPLVEGRIGSQDKVPWRNLRPFTGQVERRFLRPLILGESIAPFRLLTPVSAIIPWVSRHLVDADGALDQGFTHLAGWLKRAEALWNQHGAGKMSLIERWDYHRGLTSQFPIAPIRIVYAASGTLPCALVVRDQRAIIEHANYWSAVESEAEGRYLTAILNSEAARTRVAALQAQGQWGPRHFDKLMFTLPIPRFDPKKGLHADLFAASEEAEQISRDVELSEGIHFQSARRTIRKALRASRVSVRIERLVDALLGGRSRPK